MTRHIVTAAAILASVVMLTACGGSGDGPDITVDGPPLSNIDANSIQVSDLHFTLQDGRRERVSINCRPSGSCTARVGGQIIAFDITATDDLEIDVSDVSGTIFNTRGNWRDTEAGAVYGRIDGETARYAVALDIIHPNSLPLQGSATWRGDLVALDNNNRSVRGKAALTISDLSDPQVDVTLTPQARSALRWTNLPVVNGRFSQERQFDDYIRGEFYGRRAKETGGVFERNGLVGAFAAKQ